MKIATYHGKATDCLRIAERFVTSGIRFDLSFDGKDAIISTTYKEVLEAVRRQFKL